MGEYRPKSVTPGGPALTWPVGEPASERVGTGLPAGWSIAIGYDAEYWLGVHSGLDINKPGEADYGAACYAVAPGTVTWAGKLAGTWGNVVVVHHSNVPGIGECWSRYAHLSAVNVAAGQVVAQGERIGAVGNADGQLSAHLHFDLMRQKVTPGNWPSGRARSQSAATHAEIRRIYIDPMGRLGA